MTYGQFIESLLIFAKYSEKGLEAWAHINPAHDEFWMGPDPEKVSPEDNARLLELGWYESDYGSYHRFS